MSVGFAESTVVAATTVVFTTSPLLLDRAHRVAFIEDGRAIAIGTHRELLATAPRYAAVVTRGEDEE
jgi:ABC-type multidrug transport system fused ATPase/permease subunit